MKIDWYDTLLVAGIIIASLTVIYYLILTLTNHSPTALQLIGSLTISHVLYTVRSQYRSGKFEGKTEERLKTIENSVKNIENKI